MALNDIKLSRLIIGEWYKDTLPGALSADGASSSPPATRSPAASPVSSPAASSASSPAAASVSSPTTSSVSSPATPPSATPPSATSPSASFPADPSGHADPGPGSFKFLGGNRRHCALLVHAPGSPFLPDGQLNFLTRLLEACRLTIADVAIVNHAVTPVTVGSLRLQLQPKTILLFGVDPAAIHLPINFPAFRPQAYDDCTYLVASSLDKLLPNTEESKLLKSKLWVCLKTIFDV